MSSKRIDVARRARQCVARLLCAAELAGCTNAAPGDANGDVYAAWRDQRSHVEVTASGSIARLLGTHVGRSGAHAGFLLHLSGGAGHGLTVRVEDNVDLTGPLELQEGAAAKVRGEYLFTSRGGLIHYTHRDPRGRHAAGFIETGGRLYQ